MYDITNYFEADTVLSASNFLLENENSKIIAGGTDVLIKSREGKKDFTGIALVGVTRIEELRKIYIDDEGSIIIGASCTFSEVEKNEIIKKHIKNLAFACGTVGGPQTRNAGTVGGNVCNGATSADSATSFFVLNAILVIQNKDVVREVSIHDFYVSAGKVNLEKGDVLKYFKITKDNYEGYSGHYIKFAQRNAMDIATITCSSFLKMSGNKIEDLRIAFGVTSPTPIRMAIAEEFAKGLEFNDENVKEIAKKALENSNARDSWRGSKEYRENLVEVLTERAVLEAFKGGSF